MPDERSPVPSPTKATELVQPKISSDEQRESFRSDDKAQFPSSSRVGSQINDPHPSARLAAVTRKINEIDGLLCTRSEANFYKVRCLTRELEQKIENFVVHCNSAMSEHENASEIRKEFEEWRDHHMTIASKFLSSTIEWLENTEKLLETNELRPEDSASQVSRRTGRSSIPSSTISAQRRLNEERIKLNIELKKTEENMKLQQKEFEARMAHETMKLKIEQDRQRLTNELKQEELKLLQQELENRSNVSMKPKSNLSRTSKDNPRKGRSYSDEVSPRNCPQTVQTFFQLPRNEPETFTGLDITAYKPFILAFDRTIVPVCSNYSDKYYYLLRYTDKFPKELVKSCLGPNLTTSYRKARELLDERYGSEIHLAQEYLNKLDEWPAIKSEDSEALDKFSVYLTGCMNIMSNCAHLNQLNGWKEIKTLVMKLPFDLRKKFRAKVANSHANRVNVNFQTFVNFVKLEACSLKLPLFGDIRDQSVKQKTKDSLKAKNSNSQREIAFSTVDCMSYDNLDHNTESPKQSSTSIVGTIKCQCCSKNNHKLNDCYFFLKKSLADRELFVKAKKLCFGCLNSSNHQSKDCQNKIECKKCGKLHPTSLHKEINSKRVTDFSRRNYENISNRSSNFNAQALTASHEIDGRVICPSVPVYIKRKDTGQLIITNMAMDTYATACYMDEKLMNSLGIKGKTGSLNLTTMENSCSNVPVKIVSNLEIFSLDGSKSFVIPKIYAKNEWPFNDKDNLRESDVLEFERLKQLPFKFARENIGLLVGINVPELIRPHEVIDTIEGGPYATRHLFGWALNGPVRGKGLGNLCLRTACSETLNNDSIERYFAQEFDDHFDDPAPSVEDALWLNKVSRGIRCLPNNKYEVPLPLKNNVKFLPNNKDYALKRLESLKKKLSNDENLNIEYKKFMKDMRERNFVEEVPPNELECEQGEVWYLPHHGVRHKQKGKLRVVFDCSSKFHGISLNDCLMSGPDLTNNLLGVLIRFREGKIAISGDVEKMFYMVNLPEKDSNFLRFLWYANDDMTQIPREYRLKVHVFGAKSSPSCANYALQRCILECENLNEEISELLLRSFYVDDLMISISDVPTAKHILSKAEHALNERGFELKEFTSNSREIIKTLPADKLSKNLKESNMTNDCLSNERALGLHWNADKDEFFFKISDTVQPITKRGMLSTIFSIYDPFFVISPALITAKSLFQKACSLKLDWDTPLPINLQKSWIAWFKDIHKLNGYSIPRHFMLGFDHCTNFELHIFADGSETAYGCVAYLRFESNEGVKCSNVLSKVRLTPLKRATLKTVPRIELNAAKLAVILSLKIEKELTVRLSKVLFWTDSTIVLNYICSNEGRFQRFVANRVAFIRIH